MHLENNLSNNWVILYIGINKNIVDFLRLNPQKVIAKLRTTVKDTINEEITQRSTKITMNLINRTNIIMINTLITERIMNTHRLTVNLLQITLERRNLGISNWLKPKIIHLGEHIVEIVSRSNHLRRQQLRIRRGRSNTEYTHNPTIIITIMSYRMIGTTIQRRITNIVTKISTITCFRIISIRTTERCSNIHIT